MHNSTLVKIPYTCFEYPRLNCINISLHQSTRVLVNRQIISYQRAQIFLTENVHVISKVWWFNNAKGCLNRAICHMTILEYQFTRSINNRFFGTITNDHDLHEIHPATFDGHDCTHCTSVSQGLSVINNRTQNFTRCIFQLTGNKENNARKENRSVYFYAKKFKTFQLNF